METRYKIIQLIENTSKLQPKSSSARQKIKIACYLNQFMLLSIENQKSIDASIKNLETYIGQIAKQLVDQQRGTINSNTQKNPKEHCNAIATKSSKVSGNCENMEPKKVIDESREKQKEKKEEGEKET